MATDPESPTETITIGGTEYKLSKEINGGQYMELRRKTIESVRRVPVLKPATDGAEVSEGDKEEEEEKAEAVSRIQVQVNQVSYDYWNLVYRLVEPQLSEEEIKSLPRRIYMPLVLFAGRLDAVEARGISDFLRQNSDIFQGLQSILEPSSDSPQPISEVISD